ncbi:tetratricopeptide repeat protein [Flavobacterium pedocola]
MVNRISVLLLFLLGISVNAQNVDEAHNLVEEGIVLHDKGDFKGAIALYDKALSADVNNLFAMAEKVMTLNAMSQFKESIELAEKAIKLYPGKNDLKNIYVSCGNSYDALGMPDKSVKIYEKGMKEFPNYYQLYYNKGITLAKTNKIEESVKCFEKSISLNPNHPGSHNALARLSDQSETRVRALLAYYRFMVLEPKSTRGKENMKSIVRIMSANVKKTDENSITLNLDPDILKGIDKKQKPNSFKTTDMILSMDAALDFDDKYKDETEVERFIRKSSTFFSSLAESQKENSGFYWEYYAPYFIEMKNKNFLETFAYIAYSGTENNEIQQWLKSHEKEVTNFNNWSKEFIWKGL